MPSSKSSSLVIIGQHAMRLVDARSLSPRSNARLASQVARVVTIQPALVGGDVSRNGGMLSIVKRTEKPSWRSRRTVSG
jgi:hypothetical protein